MINNTNEKLEKLEKFLSNDLKIKELMTNLVPTELDCCDIDASIKYQDKLLYGLDAIEIKLEDMVNSYCEVGSEPVIIKEKFKKYKDTILNSGYSFEDMKKIYQNIVSNMEPKLVKDVQEKCKGYLIEDHHVSELLNESNSVNEILHVLHSHVMNDQNILKSLPKITEKETEFGKVCLYGDSTSENKLGTEIFDKLMKNEVDSTAIDIVSLDNNKKVLMMVRDVGHALSIEMSQGEKDNTFVNYFIPKITNVEKINSLKGVRQVDENSKETSGQFYVSNDRVSDEIIDFIHKVPGDEEYSNQLFLHKILSVKPIEEINPIPDIDQMIETSNIEDTTINKTSMLVKKIEKKNIFSIIKEKILLLKEKFSSKSSSKNDDEKIVQMSTPVYMSSKDDIMKNIHFNNENNQIERNALKSFNGNSNNTKDNNEKEF